MCKTGTEPNKEQCIKCPQYLGGKVCACPNQVWCKKCGNRLCYRDIDGKCKVKDIPGALPHRHIKG